MEAWSRDTARDNPAYSWRHTSWAGALKYPSGCIRWWRTHGRWTCAPGGKPAAAAAKAALAMAASWWGDRSRAFRIAGTGTGPAVWSAMRARSHQSSHKQCCCHARSAAGVRAPVPACSKGTYVEPRIRICGDGAGGGPAVLPGGCRCGSGRGRGGNGGKFGVFGILERVERRLVAPLGQGII